MLQRGSISFASRPIAAAALWGLAIGCTGGSPETAAGASWVGTITTESDVTTVVNESGSVWREGATLLEEAAIGVEAGDDPYMLGQVTGIAAHGDRIYVADAQVPAIRAYDASGTFVGNVGQEGGGPGEYRYPAGVVADANGRIHSLDFMTGRVLVYSSAGEPEATTMPLPCCRSESGLLLVSRDGDVFIIGYWRRADVEAGDEAGEALIRGLLRFGLDGSRGEIIEQPDLPSTPVRMVASDGRLVRDEPAPFHPQPVYAYAPTGEMLAGFSDAYRFEVRYPDGRRMVIERAWEPEPVTFEEADAARRGAIAYMRQRDPEWQWNVEEMPDTKPPFVALAGGINGEAWIVRQGAGGPIDNCTFDEEAVTEHDRTPCFHEPRIVDAFEPSGRFLGSFELPDDFRLEPRPWIDGETVIARTEDEAGTIRVKRYRVAVSGGAPR